MVLFVYTLFILNYLAYRWIRTLSSQTDTKGYTTGCRLPPDKPEMAMVLYYKITQHKYGTVITSNWKKISIVIGCQIREQPGLLNI